MRTAAYSLLIARTRALAYNPAVNGRQDRERAPSAAVYSQASQWIPSQCIPESARNLSVRAGVCTGAPSTRARRCVDFADGGSAASQAPTGRRAAVTF